MRGRHVTGARAGRARDGRLARNVADGVPLPRLAPADDRVYVSHRQLADLASACGRDEVAVLVLAYCGLRFGELAGLRVRDVDLMRCRLTVAWNTTEVAGRMVVDTPKGHRRRSVPIPAVLSR